MDERGASLRAPDGATASLRFDVPRLEREATRIALGGRPTRDSDACVTRRGSDGLSEQWRVDESGFEQRWSFEREPPGRGDLGVEVAFAGARVASIDDEGVHFADSHGARIRYGHATFVDAVGARSPVPVEVDGSRLAMRVPADVLDHAVYPAVLDPRVEPEFQLEGAQPAGHAGDDVESAIAYGGGVYLVAYATTAGDVFFQRVSGAGAVLDGSPVPLSLAAGWQSFPTVTFDGTDFIVAWQDFRNGNIGDIYAARVTPAGVRLDGDGFAVSSAAGQQAHPRITMAGSNAFVVWDDARNGAALDIYGARIAPDGTVLDPMGIAIDTRTSNDVLPEIASDGTQLMLVYREDTQGDASIAYAAMYRRVAFDGTLLDVNPSTVTPIGVDDQGAVVGSNGSEFVLVWGRRGAGVARDVYAQRFASDGTPAEASPRSLVAPGTGTLTPSAIASDGAGYLVGYVSTGGTLHTLRLDALAVPDAAGSRTLATGSSISWGGVAAGASGYLASGSLRVTTAPVTSGIDVLGARIAADGTVIDVPAFIISRGYDVGGSVVATSDGAQFFVGWQRSSTAVARLSRVDRSGVLLDTPPISLSSTLSAAGFDGTDFLVGNYRSSSSIVTAYGPGGALGVETLISDLNNFYFGTPSMALAGPAPSGAVATEELMQGAFRGLYFTRLSATGVASGRTSIEAPALLVAPPPYDPALATDGTNHLVVYEKAGNIVGTRVSSTGTKTAITVCSATGTQSDSALVYGSGQYLAAWTDARVAATPAIYGARISAAGVVVDVGGFALAAGPSDAARTHPQLVTIPGGYLLTWRDSRSGSPALYGARLDTTGASLDGTGFLIEGSVASTDRVAVAYAQQRVLVAYARPDASADGTLQAFAHIVCLQAVDTTCDGIDDDCDGAVDDDVPATPSVCGLGVCVANGTITCVAGQLVDSCAPGSPTGTDADCDTIDQDCDGTADDAFPVVTTSCGFGVCTASGSRVCLSGSVVDTCVPGPTAGTDTNCNLVDEDCDGFADEDYVGPSVTCGSGMCASTGRAVCNAGVIAIQCDAPTGIGPDTECDGVDQDCDGVADDGYVPAATTCGLGVCARAGLASCVGGSLFDNCVEGAPTGGDANCNGVDEDCDGVPDDAFPVVTTSCGTGACARSGTTSCVSGSVADSCVPGAPASTDVTCDGIDDNCNGTADEGGACTADVGVDAGATVDVGVDASSPSDLGVDVGSPSDVGIDVGSAVDVGIDGGAATDLGVDVGAETDASFDANPADATEPDANVADDASLPDATLPVDVAVPVDLGSQDVAASDSGGTDAGDPGTDAAVGGCSCRVATADRGTSRRGGPLAALVLLGVVVARRRRTRVRA